jgi:hypothetical protein
VRNAESPGSSSTNAPVLQPDSLSPQSLTLAPLRRQRGDERDDDRSAKASQAAVGDLDRHPVEMFL